MNTIKLVTVFIFLTIFSVKAQDIANNALGVRFGDNGGFGGEISYQKQLTDKNRLEVDLGFRDRKDNDAFKLTGIYQWVWNIDGGFNWYAGFGAGIGSWENKLNNADDGLFINADGNVGIEYNFEIPLLISLDFRPEFGIIGDYSDSDIDLALSFRYQF